MEFLVQTRSFLNRAQNTVFLAQTSRSLSIIAFSAMRSFEMVLSGKSFLLAQRFQHIAQSEKQKGDTVKATVAFFRSVSFFVTGLFLAYDAVNGVSLLFHDNSRIGEQEGRDLKHCKQLGCLVNRSLDRKIIRVHCPGDIICPEKGYTVLQTKF